MPPVAVAPAQLRIQAVSVSAQAEAEASQQLWPPATLMTMRDWSGCVRFTIVLAAVVGEVHVVVARELRRLAARVVTAAAAVVRLDVLPQVDA